MIARLEVVASAILAAGAPLLSLPLFEQSVPACKRNRLRAASRAELAHRAFDVHPYRLQREAENRRDLVGCLTGRDPTQTFALSGAQRTLFRFLEEIGKSLARSLMIHMGEEEKGHDVGFSAACPAAITTLADDRDEAEVTRRMDRHGEALDQTEVGKVVPRFFLFCRQIVACPHGGPIEANSSVEARMIVRAMRVIKMPGGVPPRGEIERSMLVHAPSPAQILCRPADIACNELVDADLLDCVRQDVDRGIDAVRGQDLFPQLMPRLHGRLPVSEATHANPGFDASKSDQFNTGLISDATPMGFAAVPRGPTATRLRFVGMLSSTDHEQESRA
jgi:hypothetical protein